MQGEPVKINRESAMMRGSYKGNSRVQIAADVKELRQIT